MELIDVVREGVGGPIAVILSGSSLFARSPRDLDLLVVGEVEDPVRLSVELSVRLTRFLGTHVQVYVVRPGDLTHVNPPVHGLALGYAVLVDEVGAEERIRAALDRAAEDSHVLMSRHGRVDLSLIARARRRKGVWEGG